MSGPDYPPPPVLNPNLPSSFSLSITATGTVLPFPWQATIVAQYANSPILTQLISNVAQYVDQTVNMDSFYNNIWNIQTAVGAGLDLLGRIMNIPRVLQVPVTTAFLGFKEAGDPNRVGFGQAQFFPGSAALTNNFTLSDDAYRTLLLAQALSNISDGSIKSINQILLTLFPGRGNCFVTDGQNRTMTYTFQFPLAQFELAIVQNSGVLPRPPGVIATVVHP